MSNRRSQRSTPYPRMMALPRTLSWRKVGFYPRIETIEQRVLLTTYTVGAGGYGSITAAVMAANTAYNNGTSLTNTVSVSPGMYQESNIPITTPMTLVSTNGAGSTTIEGPGATTITSQDGVIDVLGTAGSVTIGKPGQGFTIENPPTGTDNNTNLINVEGITGSLTIQNNTFIGAYQFGYSNEFDTGVLVESTGANAPVTITNNTFEQMWQGVLFQQTVGAGSISNNLFENLQTSYYTSGNTTIAYEPEGIFALTFGGAAYNVSGLAIVANDFSNFNGLAISVDGGYAGYTPAQFSNVDISSNVINSIGFTPNEFRAGITLIDDANNSSQESAGGVVNSIVQDNTLQAQTACASGSVGVWVLGGDNNLTIENNFIESLDSGVLIQEQVTGAGFASGIVATQNSFTGNNISINNQSSNLVSAPDNYWGAIDAISVKAQANGGVHVDYNPWLGSGTDTSSNVGFQPSLIPLYTDAFTISGNDSVQSGSQYTLSYSLTNPAPANIGTITSYSINWGDNTPPNSGFPTTPPVTTHTYNTNTQTTYTISATVTNSSGQTFIVSKTINVTVTVLSTLVVTTFTPTSSGFHVRFNHTINTSVLNLYDNVTASPPQTPDVTVVGASTGPIYGSLKLDSDNKGFTFVKTGAPLTPDTYTVTLVGATGGVQDASTGYPLDGTYSGKTTGGNYTTTVTVAPNSGPVVSLPDFARGPGQPVIVPAATGTSLPIQISDGSNVYSVMLIVTYNPALLTISGVSLPAALVADGAQFVTNGTIPGRLEICVTSPIVLNSGAQTLVNLNASVPTSAPYLSKAAIGLQVLNINGNTSNGVGDQAIEDVDFLGNATGSGSYSSADVTQIRQVLTSSDYNAGFVTFPLVDPTIIGNVSASGNLNSNDVSILRHYLTSNDLIPQIPTYTSAPTSRATGPDPELFLSQELAAMPGKSLTVPVEFKQTNDSPIDLQSFSLVIGYDPSAFTVSNITPGPLASGFQFSDRVDQTDGLIFITGTTSQPLSLTPGTLGDLAEIHLMIAKAATTGSYSLNLLDNSGTSVTSLNGGGLTLVPAPTNAGNDPNDGKVAIGGRRTEPAFRPGSAPISLPVPSSTSSPKVAIQTSKSSILSASTTSSAGSSPASSTTPVSPVSTLPSPSLQLHDLAISVLTAASPATSTSPEILLPLTTGGMTESSSETVSVSTTRRNSTLGVAISPRGYAFRHRVLSRVIASSDSSQ